MKEQKRTKTTPKQSTISTKYIGIKDYFKNTWNKDSNQAVPFMAQWK